MAVEARRGCGYRKVGGLYMVGGPLASPCGRLPLELHVCPACNAGIKQTRAWQWIKPRILLASAPPCFVAGGPPKRIIAGGVAITHERAIFGELGTCHDCPLDPANLPERAGLIWVGEKFYPTPDAFMREARELGVSRRIPAVPRNFVLGETWVLIAHPRAIYRAPTTPEELLEAHGELMLTRKGVISMFRPVAIEKIVTATEAQNADAMSELAAKGITPVAVPDDDRDHQGSVYEDPQAELE